MTPTERMAANAGETRDDSTVVSQIIVSPKTAASHATIYIALRGGTCFVLPLDESFNHALENVSACVNVLVGQHMPLELLEVLKKVTV